MVMCMGKILINPLATSHPPLIMADIYFVRSPFQGSGPAMLCQFASLVPPKSLLRKGYPLYPGCAHT